MKTNPSPTSASDLFNAELGKLLAHVSVTAVRHFERRIEEGTAIASEVVEASIRRALVSGWSHVHGYGIEPSLLLAAELLEDVNAHTEAAPLFIRWRAMTEAMASFTADYTVRNEGSVFLVTPNTPEAKAWLKQSTDGQWFGESLAVEHRYVTALVEGLRENGFSVA